MRAWLAITALALGVVTPACAGDRRALGACDVRPRAQVERIAGVREVPEPFEPENTGIDSTGCSYGQGEPGTYLTVFSVARGGAEMMRRARTVGEAHGAVFMSLNGPGYEGYTSVGPRPGSESAVVVKHDHHVEVIAYNTPPGTAAKLAIVAAGRLR